MWIVTMVRCLAHHHNFLVYAFNWACIVFSIMLCVCIMHQCSEHNEMSFQTEIYSFIDFIMYNWCSGVNRMFGSGGFYPPGEVGLSQKNLFLITTVGSAPNTYH